MSVSGGGITTLTMIKLLLFLLLPFLVVEEATAGKMGKRLPEAGACGLVGKGGCRGSGWNDAPWPKEGKGENADDCCKSCLETKGCTSFHVTAADKKNKRKSECLLFGHANVASVERLGGKCYRANKIPEPKKGKKDGNDKIEAKVQSAKQEAKKKAKKEKAKKKAKTVSLTQDYDPEKEYEGGLFLNMVGAGGCRGPKWDKDPRYPKFLGRETLDKCAKKCAKDGECTAIHVLRPDLKDGTVECLHFSHDKVTAVEPLGGHCYEIDDEMEGEDEDDGEHCDIDGSVEPVILGEGMCRGPGWTDGVWPIIEGRHTLKQCAEACASTKGCLAFDLSHGQKSMFDCILYGHNPVVPAEAVAGQCYSLKDRLEEAIENEDDGEHDDHDDDHETDTDDGKPVKMEGKVEIVSLGQGMCRGKSWQRGVWPIPKGHLPKKKCAEACAKTKNCLAFDLSEETDKERFKCFLYGNEEVAPASGVPGECFTLKDRLDDLHSENIDEELFEDHKDDGKDIKFDGKVEIYRLGKGVCRGRKWTFGVWPIIKGYKDKEKCAQSCAKTSGCLAFDITKAKTKGKTQCHLYGHRGVKTASGVPGECFSLKDRVDDAVDPTDEDDYVFEEHDDEELEEEEDDEVEWHGKDVPFHLLGTGMCRGFGWTGGKWPIGKGEISVQECANACAAKAGCTAFDLSHQYGEKDYEHECLLYKHKKVAPASGVKGNCFVLGEEEVETEPEVEVKPRESKKSKSQTVEKESRKEEKGKRDKKEKVKEEKVKNAPAKKPSGSSPSKAVKKEAAKKSKPKNAQEEEDADDEEGNNDIGGRGQKKKRGGKIPKFDPPRVLEEEKDDDDWLFEPPPPEVRSREHIGTIFGLNEKQNTEVNQITEKTLKDLKKVYENAIKPLEGIYKYRELSNRHFGDPEIFGKPLIVLMGPYSGGKSTMINYLLGTEFTENAFRAAAEPSPGFNFNIALHGDRNEELEGTELAAEFGFSSLQKFGQEFLKKLRAKKMPNKLLERATFVEIPGVLETGSRKVDRRYPFNDACQWFIDHADLILLVYDYAKLDIGPETEALLDQLKGRETQVRIILNKADQITAEELLKIQGNLVWNVSPMMASLEPPTLYAGSFWSRPYQTGAPSKLLKAQELTLLKDIREAMDRRIDNRIATARRFAVRVRNHAKMVDCYLNTFNNHMSFFGDKKAVAKGIVDNPQKYHIYEGISTMTNISRYDLPDPTTYRQFFGLHPLYDFPSLQSTCTFFKGCPINKLDLCIAYDLPELMTGYKRKAVEARGGGKIK